MNLNGCKVEYNVKRTDDKQDKSGPEIEEYQITWGNISYRSLISDATFLIFLHSSYSSFFLSLIYYIYYQEATTRAKHFIR